MAAVWRRYEELRPDELADMVARTPVAFWPLGLLEHHGWHLPIGFDGLKAQALCERVAARTGGVLLPVMWWGGEGGHGCCRWTHYQRPEAAAAILDDTVGQLLRHGFLALVLPAGHYPWQRLLDRILPRHRAAHPRALLLAGTEVSICAETVRIGGDHAARAETSFGLALFPELVRLEALTAGRDEQAWPGGQPPPPEGRHPGVCWDPASPCFAQMGADARTATAADGWASLDPLVERLAALIGQHLDALPR